MPEVKKKKSLFIYGWWNSMLQVPLPTFSRSQRPFLIWKVPTNPPRAAGQCHLQAELGHDSGRQQNRGTARPGQEILPHPGNRPSVLIWVWVRGPRLGQLQLSPPQDTVGHSLTSPHCRGPRVTARWAAENQRGWAAQGGTVHRGTGAPGTGTSPLSHWISLIEHKSKDKLKYVRRRPESTNAPPRLF